MKRPAGVSLALALGGAVMGFGWGTAAIAHAHSAGSFYYSGWPAGHNETYWFRDNVPTGNFRSRVIDGAYEWNDTPNDGNAEPNFYNGGEKSDSGGDWNQPCQANYSAIYFRDLDSISSGAVGYTPFCKVVVSDGGNSWTKITKFSLNLDSDRDWYTGTGDAPDWPPDVDAWSIASHEFGHATGWEGHFNDSGDQCPGDGTEATMCPVYEGGSERWRTLSDHDSHTFENQYPYP